ncbi:MAG: hypothetical protein AAB893_00405 [Patescibacteria group bacterium]
MKKFLNWLPNWFILPVLSLLFLATWPLILIVIGIKALFNKKSSDSQKITGAKATILTLSGLVIVGLFVIYQYPLLRFLDRFPWQSLFAVAIIGLFVLAILQKIFPCWKWLKKNPELS